MLCVVTKRNEIRFQFNLVRHHLKSLTDKWVKVLAFVYWS